MRKPLIRNWLPGFMRKPLWGDRQRWGLSIRPDDPCWIEWERTVLSFYVANQREGFGAKVNDAGYAVMRNTDIDGKTVLEIGPGDIRHNKYWQGLPDQYWLADIDSSMLETAERKLTDLGVRHRSTLLTRGDPLPFNDASVDIVVSFYSLEHIYPLQPYLDELNRVLRTGGTLIGAVPAEGGLAWGLGRFLSSRRWFRKNTTIDPDKIICWEHPNFADTVIDSLDQTFDRALVSRWPFAWLPSLDFNLIVQFMYTKRT